MHSAVQSLQLLCVAKVGLSYLLQDSIAVLTIATDGRTRDDIICWYICIVSSRREHFHSDFDFLAINVKVKVPNRRDDLA